MRFGTLKIFGADGCWLTLIQLLEPASFFSMKYPLIRPPPSLGGCCHVKLTKSPPTSSTLGSPGALGASGCTDNKRHLGVQTTRGIWMCTQQQASECTHKWHLGIHTTRGIQVYMQQEASGCTHNKTGCRAEKKTLALSACKQGLIVMCQAHQKAAWQRWGSQPRETRPPHSRWWLPHGTDIPCSQTGPGPHTVAPELQTKEADSSDQLSLF